MLPRDIFSRGFPSSSVSIYHLSYKLLCPVAYNDFTTLTWFICSSFSVLNVQTCRIMSGLVIFSDRFLHEKEIKKWLEEETGREENEGKMMEERQKIKTKLTIVY